MSESKALERCLWVIKEYGYISEDGILDMCDEEMKLVSFVHKKLTKMVENGELTNDEYGG